MAKFIVGVKELHIQYLTIEASTQEEAAKMVIEGDGDLLVLEYLETQSDGPDDVDVVEENTEQYNEIMKLAQNKQESKYDLSRE